MSVPTDPRPSTLWHSFFKGWQDGCACKPRRPEFIGSDDPDVRECYEHGYEAGVCDRRKTQSWATLQYGYSPTVLREAALPAHMIEAASIKVERCEHNMPKGYLCTHCVEKIEAEAEAARKLPRGPDRKWDQ